MAMELFINYLMCTIEFPFKFKLGLQTPPPSPQKKQKHVSAKLYFKQGWACKKYRSKAEMAIQKGNVAAVLGSLGDACNND